jgi:hypothetical protein
LYFSVLFAESFNLSAQKIGSKVKVFSICKGQWKNATLLSNKNGQYFVHFDNYSEVYDRLVNDNEIVFIDGDDRKPVIIKDTVYIGKSGVDTVFRGKDNAVVLQNVKEDTISMSKTIRDTIYKTKRDTLVINRTIKDTVIHTKTETINVTPDNTTSFRLGELVQVYQDSEWKPAVILEIKGGDQYKVKYDGLSDFYNNVVGVGSIKPR